MGWKTEHAAAFASVKTLGELADLTFSCARDVVGVSAAAFIPAPPISAYADGMTMFHEQFSPAQIVERTREAHPLTVKDLVSTGRVLIPSTTIDISAAVGNEYLESTEVYNEFWRPCRIERQLLSNLGDLGSPYATICFARSRRERAFSEKETAAAHLVGRAAELACKRLFVPKPDDFLLVCLHNHLGLACAVFDGVGFPLWANSAAKEEWRQPDPGANRLPLSCWRGAVLECAAGSAPVLHRGVLRVSRSSADNTLAPYVVERTASDVPLLCLSSWARRWGLTRRETEVIELIAAGKSHKEAARELNCSPRTIEVHVSAILRKANTATCKELVALVAASAMRKKAQDAKPTTAESPQLVTGTPESSPAPVLV